MAWEDPTEGMVQQLQDFRIEKRRTSTKGVASTIKILKGLYLFVLYKLRQTLC
jgi:hypothetical protein